MVKDQQWYGVILFLWTLDEADFSGSPIDITFPADEGAEGPIHAVQVPVLIVDDDVNEALLQIFIAHLEVISAADISLVYNTDRNTSICEIIDNDSKKYLFLIL